LRQKISKHRNISKMSSAWDFIPKELWSEVIPEIKVMAKSGGIEPPAL
jgi:hypothetical protein